VGSGVSDDVNDSRVTTRPSTSTRTRRVAADRERRATAYHEAGHAVVAWAEGIRLRSVSIIPTDDTDGRVEHVNQLWGSTIDSNRSDANRLKAERHVRVSLAGQLAQRKFDRRTVRKWHAQRDHESAVNVLGHLVQSNRELEAWLDLLSIQTEQLLKLHWQMVRGLAQELMKRNRMGGKELRDWLNTRA